MAKFNFINTMSSDEHKTLTLSSKNFLPFEAIYHFLFTAHF